jgi:hypothetical protein
MGAAALRAAGRLFLGIGAAEGLEENAPADQSGKRPIDHSG